MTIRKLRRHEVLDIWSIDRTEVIDEVYYRVGKELVLKPEHHDVKGWPPGEPEHDGPILLDCSSLALVCSRAVSWGGRETSYSSSSFM